MKIGRTASRILAAISAIPVFLCAAPAAAQRVSEVILLERPQVVALTAPQFVETDSSFKVEVSASYLYGISAIEIGFNGRIQRIPVRSEQTASAVAEFVARDVRDNQLSVVAVSADGRQRSAARIQPVMIGMEKARRAPQSLSEYSKRLADTG